MTYNQTPSAELAAIEQCDRDAAKSLLGRDDAGPSWWSIDSGNADSDPLVQAFARHRAQAGDALRDYADAVVSAFEAFNHAEHNRQDCPECENDGPWFECGPCSEKVGDLLNRHLLAIDAYKVARLTALRSTLDRSRIKSILIDHGIDDVSGAMLDELAGATPEQGELARENVWRRFHGAVTMPTDWTGGECYFGDGTEGTPKGHQWGPFNDNMVVFYPASVSGELQVAERVADRVCLDVCELPDRTSPDDWPEALLVTSDELHEIVVAALTATPDAEGNKP